LGTLYNYFASKERFFSEVLLRWAEGLATAANKRASSQATPAERLRATIHQALRAFEQRPQMARLMTVLVMSTDPAVGEMLVRLEQSVSDAYLQALWGVEPTRARCIVDVLQAVFAIQLREWSMGRRTITEAHNRLDAAIDLLA
jgi:AcrR family transcriptional regulator